MSGAYSSLGRYRELQNFDQEAEVLRLNLNVERLKTATGDPYFRALAEIEVSAAILSMISGRREAEDISEVVYDRFPQRCNLDVTKFAVGQVWVDHDLHRQELFGLEDNRIGFLDGNGRLIDLFYALPENVLEKWRLVE